MINLKNFVISEKSADLMRENTFVMLVDRKANEKMIIAEIEKYYKVKPIKLRLLNLPLKKVQFRRIEGVRSSYKKCYFSLKKGETIAGLTEIIAKYNKDNPKDKSKEKNAKNS